MVDMASDQWYAWTVNKHEEIFGSKRVPKLTGLLSVDLLEQKKKKSFVWFGIISRFQKTGVSFLLASTLRTYLQTPIPSIFLVFLIFSLKLIDIRSVRVFMKNVLTFPCGSGRVYF